VRPASIDDFDLTGNTKETGKDFSRISVPKMENAKHFVLLKVLRGNSTFTQPLIDFVSLPIGLPSCFLSCTEPSLCKASFCMTGI
jgi:hypothetical protein